MKGVANDRFCGPPRHLPPPLAPSTSCSDVNAVKINGTVVYAPKEPDPLDALMIQARPEQQKIPECRMRVYRSASHLFRELLLYYKKIFAAKIGERYRFCA